MTSGTTLADPSTDLILVFVLICAGGWCVGLSWALVANRANILCGYDAALGLT